MAKRAFQIGIVGISDITARIEQGLYYGAIASEPAIANNAFLDVLIRTPLDLEPAVALKGKVGGDALAFLYENTIVSNDGIEIVAKNHRRRPPVRPAFTKVFKGPTLISPGDPDPIIPGSFIPGGQTIGNRDLGGESDLSIYQLAADTLYLARLQNISGGSQALTLDMNFVEPATGTVTGN